MNDEPEVSDDCDKALTHAWQWFEYHANQRHAVFRYFIVVMGASAAGYLTALNNKYFLFATCIALFGALSAIIFLKLDTRNSKLIKIGEDAMNVGQQRLSKRLGHAALLIVERADSASSGLLGSFRKVFKAFGHLLFALFAIAFVYSCRLIDYQDFCNSWQFC